MTSLDQMLSIGIAFVILGIGLAIGLVVLQDLKEDQMTTEAGSTSIVNVSFTPAATGTAVTVADAEGEECSVTSCVVINQSDQDVVSASNYTAGFTGCSLTITFLDVLENDSLKNASCTYTRATENYFYNASKSGQEGVSEFTSWLPTVAIVMVAVFILGIVVVYLARKFI